MNIFTIENRIFNSRSYILTTSKNNETWLVDCGDHQPIFEFIEANNLFLKGILITHTHFDHIYGLNEVISNFPKAKVYTSNEGQKGLYDITQNLSKFNENPWSYRFYNVEMLTEQSDLIVLDKEVRIYSTPGHDLSCLTFKIDEFLFTGDSYIPGNKTFTKWPLSNNKEANLSYNKIMEIVKKENLIIKAGH